MKVRLIVYGITLSPVVISSKQSAHMPTYAVQSHALAGIAGTASVLLVLIR
jgi:hypothetical protein